MNHRTHSGSSTTVITNPNAFDSSASTTAKKTISGKTNHHQHNHKRLNAPESAHSSNRSGGTTKNPLAIDFDALESIPFDDVTTDNINTDNINGPTTTTTTTTPTNHDTNAHISAVFKKLTTYFSQSTSHKTLTNSQINNHKNSFKRTRNLKHKPQLGDHKLFSCKSNSIDNCAVFEKCDAVSVPVPVSSNSGSVCNDDTSSPSIEKQAHFLTNPMQTNLHHSSDKISVSNKISLSVNAMCRADDSYSLDERLTTTSTMPSPNHTQANHNTKRTNDLKSKLETAGETFSLPRVSLRQR